MQEAWIEKSADCQSTMDDVQEDSQRRADGQLHQEEWQSVCIHDGQLGQYHHH